MLGYVLCLLSLNTRTLNTMRTQDNSVINVAVDARIEQVAGVINIGVCVPGTSMSSEVLTIHIARHFHQHRHSTWIP